MAQGDFRNYSAKTQDALGLPEGFKTWSMFPFGSLNLQDERVGIQDSEFYWRENLIRLGNGSLRSLWDIGASIYTVAPTKQIVSFYWFNIGPSTYAIVFLDDGTAVQVAYPSGTVTNVSTVPGTFYDHLLLPATAQWGSKYLLISNNFDRNNYWVWDGSVLFGSGTLGPTVTMTAGGAGYSSAPTVTAYGGNGTGATFLATISGGSVISVAVTNPGTGYEPGDEVQLAFSGGGGDNSAILQAVLTAGNIDHVNVTDGGSGFTAPPTIGFTGGAGSGAAADAVLVATTVDSVTVDSGGSGYSSTPNILFTGGGGSGAAAVATVALGVITGITVISNGSGYTSLPTITITDATGTGAAATAVLSPTSVDGIVVTNGGSGYTGTPTVTFTGGGGTGASAVAILSAGSVASVTIVNGGTGFRSTPLLTFVGGGGANATATASLTDGVITSVTVTNGGNNYTSAPAVEVQTGQNDAASATVTLMPFGVSGSGIETFNSRVWLTDPNSSGMQQNGGTLLVSEPGSQTDFSEAAGGLTFPSNSPFIRARFTGIHQSNGYLYPFGDSSVDVISNVDTSGDPPTTTFNYQNTDPQTGAAWRQSIQDYGRTTLFSNALGVFGLYGGAVTKISSKIDQLFTTALFPPAADVLTPSTATASLFNIKTFLQLMTVTDPFTLEARNVMIGWDETNWMIASQSADLIYIGTQEINSSLTAWGTDGDTLFPLFQTPSATLVKKVSSKLFGVESFPVEKQLLGFWMLATDKSAAAAGITFTGVVNTDYGDLAFEDPIEFTSPVFASQPNDMFGVVMGVTLTSTSPDFVVQDIVLGYREYWGGYGTRTPADQ